MVTKSWVAIIPARGGSKRIPLKNIHEFMGKPMIAHTIEAALKSEIFDDIIVSTDNEKIAKLSESFGARVPFMRKELADDYTPISAVTVNALNILEQEFEERYTNVAQLMANCPLRSSKDIEEATNFFISSGNKFQISCFEFGWMNPWWAHTINENNIANPLFNDEIRMKRSQDQPPLYCPSGAIWIADTKSLTQSGTFYGPNYSFFPMRWENSLDIDDYNDLKMGSIIAKGRESQV